MRLAPGQRLGNYTILGSLGVGGMGQVYRARDERLGRDVAIKVLTEEVARNPDGVRRLLAEAKAASALNHPNILTVHAIGEEDGSPYVVTELVDGETLRDQLKAGAMAPDRAVDIALQTLSGLAKAHGIGLVHRDLKPENLMLTRDGIVKILDFGLAKLLDGGAGERPLETLGVAPTATGIVMGTASYMSPEQARGQGADARSDFFSLGVILYEMLAGTNPFRRPTIADTVSALLRDTPPPLADTAPFVPADLAACVDRLIDKDPNNRPATGREIEAELSAIRARLRGASGGTPAFHPALDRVASGPTSAAVSRSGAPRPATSHRGIWAAAVALPVVIAAAFLLLRGRHAADEPSMFKPGSQVVAVMAIDNRTQDQELAQADVGRILSDAFVQILYDCQGLQVVSPLRIQSLVMGDDRKFDDTGHDVRFAHSVCRRSGANTVLSGDLSQIGNVYVLNAALTELATGKLVGNFQARAEGREQILTALTSDIATAVKQKLGVMSGVTVAGGRPLGEITTASFPAYAHYKAGLDYDAIGDFAAAVPELQKAVELDPTMGVAWVELVCAYSFLGQEAKSNDAMARAQALRSRMNRKEQLWVDANALWLEGNGAKYRNAILKYLEEFPDDRQGMFYVGLSYEWLDHDCQSALVAYQKAYALTPEYYPLTKGIADCSEKLGDRAGAVRALQRYLDHVKTGLGVDQARGRLQELQRSNRS